ncbi:MAG: helix-turn-helix transcriptional regulator [Clostridia bacterium]|nr:helix-turn-helix transcriptional regulator [Clostridia bacterium]
MNKIRYCREYNGMSQKYVALSVGVSCPMVSQWESGKKDPSRENLVKLANLFGVTTDYLLDHETLSQSPAISMEEQQLINIYRQLNRAGKDLLISTADNFLSQASLREEGSISKAE